MTIPTLRGTIARRLLVNFRANPETVAPLLPRPFRPKLHGESALVGVCLIRLENLRPAFSPLRAGFSSENAAHRFAVEWTDENGAEREGVYIARRDTGSLLTRLAGGRLFPGQHFGADFKVEESQNALDFSMRSHDGQIEVSVRGAVSQNWPADSCFASLEEASQFFRAGSVGYSPRREGKTLDGLRLETRDWRVEHLAASEATSSFYADSARFPDGKIAFDHVLLMRDIEHEWHGETPFQLA